MADTATPTDFPEDRPAGAGLLSRFAHGPAAAEFVLTARAHALRAAAAVGPTPTNTDDVLRRAARIETWLLRETPDA